jgi:hypothetical protein
MAVGLSAVPSDHHVNGPVRMPDHESGASDMTPLRSVLATCRAICSTDEDDRAGRQGLGLLRPAEDLLSEEQLGRGGLLDPAPVRSRWATHLSGAVDHSFPLWTVLCFQAWRQRWGVES